MKSLETKCQPEDSEKERSRSFAVLTRIFRTEDLVWQTPEQKILETGSEAREDAAEEQEERKATLKSSPALETSLMPQDQWLLFPSTCNPSPADWSVALVGG